VNEYPKVSCGWSSYSCGDAEQFERLESIGVCAGRRTSGARGVALTPVCVCTHIAVDSDYSTLAPDAARPVRKLGRAESLDKSAHSRRSP
jgi:hypothetical protein